MLGVLCVVMNQIPAQDQTQNNPAVDEGVGGVSSSQSVPVEEVKSFSDSVNRLNSICSIALSI